MKTDLQWSGQTWGFPGGTVVENLPANKGDAGNMGSIPGSGGFHPWVRRVPSLGQEDSLEKEMATHSSILAWEIPWTEEPGGL